MLEFATHDSIREIRFARPPAHAFNGAMLHAIDAALRESVEQGARAIVVSGTPGMFSGGLDVPELLGLDRAGMIEFWKIFFQVQATLAHIAVPIVAAITGHSPAGGAVLSLYCDYRIMAQGKYRIGLNEVQVGLCPGPLIYAVLRRLIGARHADRLISGGLLVTGDEALQIGLVDRLVPEAEVVPAAIEWARGMTALPPKAVAATRRYARADLMALLGKFTAADYEMMNEAWFSGETQATMRKLVERLKK